MFMQNVCRYVLDWVGDGVMFWFSEKDALTQDESAGE